MIRLGLRLTIGSGREAAVRAGTTAAAVALGVALLLFVLAGVNGLRAQTERGAWLNTDPLTHASNPGGSTSDPLWWLFSTDQFANRTIDRVDVAATGPHSPVPPGIPRLPGPGELYVSPALAALLATTPAAQLADRFPGHQIGVIGPAALPSPDSLVAVVGHSEHELSSAPGASEVRAIQRTPTSCSNCPSGTGSGPVLQWILAAGAVALLLPVLILIATSTRLSAARREERFAAMRLVGATPRQVSVVAAVEATVAGVAGMVVGFALFFAFRPLVMRVPFTGVRFAPGDLSLNFVDALVVGIGVPVAAAVSARLALRRVQLSPLGVTRRAPSAPPGAIRVVPLLLGLAVLAYFDAVGKPKSNGGQMLEVLVGVTLILVGLMVAGPWLTKVGSRVMAERATRAATLIAGRRLLDNPRAAFRSISGLVLALFVTAAAIGLFSSVLAASTARGGTGSTSTLDAQFCGVTSSCDASTAVRSVPAETLRKLRTTQGVNGVTVVHVGATPEDRLSGTGVVSCAELATTPAIGRCRPGAATASVGYFLQHVTGRNSKSSSTVWPPGDVSEQGLARLPVEAVVVATDGSAPSIERARTALEEAFPFRPTPTAVRGLGPEDSRILSMVQSMTDVIVVASLIIAACSLAVNIAAGLSERKRPFSLLRLMGVSTGVLHRVVTLESALPLLLVSSISILVGLVAAALFLSSQADVSFHVPSIAFWAMVVAGLMASLAIIAATFPLLNRITGPETARNG